MCYYKFHKSHHPKILKFYNSHTYNLANLTPFGAPLPYPNPVGLLAQYPNPKFSDGIYGIYNNTDF